MCGICGAVQLRGVPRRVLAPGALERMTHVIEHRGPDDFGSFVAPGVAIGARRLSVVDVAGGHQPFHGETTSVWGAQNGEIYNHVALRHELEAAGHRFRSRCDTEVIPHAYERFGPSFVDRLAGMFALVVWDGARRRLVLARDRLGVKPLYYARVGDVLVFGSELKCLLASGLVTPDLDYEAISAYLTLGYFPAPTTPLSGVRKLAPGHTLTIEDGRAQERRYWRFPTFEAQGEQVDEGEWAERLLGILEESVQARLMSDVPLGAMLSGGLDSSLIVGLMARNMSKPVQTFSIGFAEDAAGNELSDARRVASHFGADHHQMELSIADQSIGIEDLVWHLDEPIADLSALGMLALSKLASRHVTVALSGQGADELLGGYRKHRAARIIGAFDAIPPSLRTCLPALAAHRFGGLARLTAAFAAPDPARRHLAMSGLLDEELRGALVRGPLSDASDDDALRLFDRLRPGLPSDALASTLQLDSQLALVDDMLHYFDRMSMAYSLEVRVPFLDHRVVEFCASVPSSLKVRGRTTKHLLKRAARGIVPDDIIHKRKLGFFRTAASSWLEAQIDRSLRDYLFDGEPLVGEFLHSGAVKELVRGQVLAPDGRHSQLVLAILMLEAWLRSYVDRVHHVALEFAGAGAA